MGNAILLLNALNENRNYYGQALMLGKETCYVVSVPVLPT